MTKLLSLPQPIADRRQFGVFDDFLSYTDAQLWTKLAADTTATVAAGTAVGGTVVLTTDATDNNEAAVALTVAVFKFADDKPLLFESRLQYAEAATDDANVFAGFGTGVNTANFLQDNGAGPKASFSGAGLYKVDGGTVWNCITSVGSTQQKTESTATAGGATAQTLRVEVQPVSSTVAEVTFFVDGVQLVDSNGYPIKHSVTMTSAAAMTAGVAVKAGGATSEVVNVDYIGAYQLR